MRNGIMKKTLIFLPFYLFTFLPLNAQSAGVELDTLAVQHQGDDHHTHNALRVDGVVNVHATSLRRVVRHVKEGLKAVEHRTEGMQLATLFEVRLYLIEIIS